MTVGTAIYSADVQSSQITTRLKADSLERQPAGPSAAAGGHGMLFAYGSRERVPQVYWLAAGSTVPKRLMLGATPTYVPAWKRLLVHREGVLLARRESDGFESTWTPNTSVAVRRNVVNSPCAVSRGVFDDGFGGAGHVVSQRLRIGTAYMPSPNDAVVSPSYSTTPQQNRVPVTS